MLVRAYMLDTQDYRVNDPRATQASGFEGDTLCVKGYEQILLLGR